jgi:hypothetical protein|tara:strand:- start:8612 stop:9472 length:861 start_codon:yes stop_codon:yes gene_type:complete
MTTGVIFFAYNNSAVDYIKQAVYNAKLVKQHLGLSVTIVTDSVNYLKTTYPFYIQYVDNIIYQAPDKVQFHQKSFHAGEHHNVMADWKNTNRGSAYDLSPYDTTIILDTDYLINNSNFLKVLDQPNDLYIYQHSADISHSRIIKGFDAVSDETIDFYWATAVVFKKTDRIKKLFNLVNYIKEQYHYFRTLYRIPTKMFRNDYAFSIAIHMLNGHSKTEWPVALPGKMIYSSPEDDLLSIKDGTYKFVLGNKYRPDKVNAVTVTGTNIHIMNKLHLNDLIDKEFENE